MAALVWDKSGERLYETGDKEVALFVSDGKGGYGKGVAWNGVTAITESPSGAEATDLWADDSKYATIRSAEQFGGTIEAYMYPDEWEECDGSATPEKGLSIGMQSRKSFGLAFVSTVGNDTELNDYGEKLHLIYGATASPSDRSYTTINDSPEAITFSWEFETTPVSVEGYKPTSHIVIDKKKIESRTTESQKGNYENFKKFVYGDESHDAYLPTPDEVIKYFTTGTAPGGLQKMNLRGESSQVMSVRDTESRYSQ